MPVQEGDTARKITIALVANTAWSIYRFRLGLARKLKQAGFEVVLIAPSDPYATLLVREGFTFEPVYMRQHRATLFSEVSILYQFYRLYKRYKPRLIFHYTIKPNIYGSMAARLLNLPGIAITTGLGQFLSDRPWFFQKVLELMYKLGAACSKEVWFLNEEDKAVFLKKGITNRLKTAVLPSEGVNVSDFQPRQNAPVPAPVFLFAGRLLKEKGVLLFVEAARRIKTRFPQLRFQVLGFIDPENPDSVTHADVKQWISEGWIEYLGESDDVAFYLERCSCLVFPSHYREGVPRILLEAACMAKPIITSNSVGCKEVVRHGENGYLCTPHDVENLVDCLDCFLQLKPEELREMGQKGRELVLKKFDEQVIVRRYFDTIAQLGIPIPRPEMR